MYVRYEELVPYLDSAKNSSDEYSLSFLFNEFYPIVLRHIVKNFRKIRVDILEDVAIETIEDWLLNIRERDLAPKHIGFILCSDARHKLFIMLKPKTQFLPFSNFENDNRETFLDAVVYKELASINYDDDLAKLTFRLKAKIDRYICDLSDKDYKILTEYLNGSNENKIAKEANINQRDVWRFTQNAFHNLKRLVNNSKNIYFDEARKNYLSKEIEYTYPDIMKMYYGDMLSIGTISDITGLKYSTVKGRIKRDTDKLKYDGLSYKMYMKKLKNKFNTT